MPDVFERERTTLLENSYLVIEGEMQNVDHVTSIKAARIVPLHMAEAAVPSPATHAHSARGFGAAPRRHGS